MVMQSELAKPACDPVGVMPPRRFAGSLTHGSSRCDVVATIHVDKSGEVVFAFDPVDFSEDSRFLFELHHTDHDVAPLMRFAGVTTEGIEFQTDDFHLNQCPIDSDESGTRLKLAGECLTGMFHRALAAPEPLPLLCMHIRGVRSFGSYEALCRLGRVVIAVHREDPDSNLLSGSISLKAIAPPDALAAWRAGGEKLLDHVRRVMSFAASALLRAPIVEFYAGDRVEVRTWSQTMQGTAGLPTIQRLRHEAIFAAAVASFFDPPIRVNQLFFAMEWFTVESTYNEVRLVGAMTALENLSNANLDESDVLIEAPKVFEKTRRALRRVIRRCLEKWPVDRAGDVLDELNEKLADLNRRSLFRKVKILAERWSVPLADISDAKLKAAIDARNRVVHRGQYYEDRRLDDPNLWTHVTIIREVVVRFIFTALGYHGDYISYVGRARHTLFPPPS